MMRFYAPFITEATPQVTMALRSERAMVGRRQKYRGDKYSDGTDIMISLCAEECRARLIPQKGIMYSISRAQTKTKPLALISGYFIVINQFKEDRECTMILGIS